MGDIMNANWSCSEPVTVVGAGNWLIASDRVGPMVLERIRGRYGSEVAVRDMGSAGLALLDYLHGQELLCVVDACLLGGSPGQINVLELSFAGTPDPVSSLHQIGPLETLTIAARLYPETMPARTILIGIETEGIDDRTEEIACEEAVTVLDGEIERWRKAKASLASADQTGENLITAGNNLLFRAPEVDFSVSARREDTTMSDVTDTTELSNRVQGLMVFLGSLTDSLETSVGRGAKAVCARAGRKTGLNRDVQRTEQDLLDALEAVREEMLDMGINWPFSPYKKSAEPELITHSDGIREVDLPFNNCIVRCSLFRYGFPQGKSLCETKHGLFCGLFEKVYGARAKLDITHAGENACLLKLKVYEGSDQKGKRS